MKTYNSMNSDANYVIENYDKGYIILGNRVDQKYGWIIKTDINGNILWNKKLGNGNYLIFPKNIERTPDNGYIIGGTTTEIKNQQDAFLMKLNSCGEVDWCTINYTASVSYDLGWNVKPIPTGGYILLGMLNDPIHRIHLFRFDNNGYLLWHQFYLPDSLLFDENSFKLLIDTDGFIITGYGFYPDPGQSDGWQRPYFIKTDTSGNPIWKLVYVGNNYYHGNGSFSLVSPSGNYYCAGRHYRVDGDSPALIKYFHNGQHSYNADLISNSYLGLVVNVVQKDDTTLIFSGAWAIPGVSSPVGLIKSDTMGNVIKTKQFYSNYGELVNSTAKTFDNKFISVMTHCSGSTCAIYAYKVNSNLEYDSIYTQPFTYDSLCPYPIVSDTLDLNCITVGIEEPQAYDETTKLKVYPNPASQKLTLEFPKYLVVNTSGAGVQSTVIYHQWNSTILEAYNLFGRQVYSKEIPKTQDKLEMNISGWQPGMYLFRLVYQKRTAASVKVVIQ